MKPITACLVFLLYSYITISIYFNCNWCKYNQNTEILTDQIAVSTIDTDTTRIIKPSNKLVILKGAVDTLFVYPTNIKVLPKTDSIILPIDFDTVIQDLEEYLDTNPTSAIEITSKLDTSETADHILLQRRRALLLRKKIITKHINGNRIYIDSVSKNAGQILNIRVIKMDSTRLKVYENKITRKLLYSRFNGYRFKPDTALIAYTKEIKSYLQRYPSKVISVIGHTDSIGSLKNNLWFGKIRAKNVKKYLVSEGIDQEKIKIYSKGETSPIAPNDTEINKAKNRRIEIIIN